MSTAYYGRAVPLALRRFPRLRFLPVSTPRAAVPEAPLRPPAGPLELPGGLPPGVHVVLLMRRLRQIEHADSWLSVREVWERLLAERSLQREGEMQFYICCMLPRFWPLRWWWRYRVRQWADLLGEENPHAHVYYSSEWTRDFYERLQIHDDGRAYAMVIRNDGEILWASHDAFKANLQEQEMVHVVNRECEWRVDEDRRLLEDIGQNAGALEADSDVVAGSEDNRDSAASAAPRPPTDTPVDPAVDVTRSAAHNTFTAASEKTSASTTPPSHTLPGTAHAGRSASGGA